jgi:hypothetical protein
MSTLLRLTVAPTTNSPKLDRPDEPVPWRVSVSNAYVPLAPM